MADGNYVPRHGTARPRRYRLRITSNPHAIHRFSTEIDIAVYGVDNPYFMETNQVYHVGQWASLDASTISHSGAGMFYFDMRGSAVLTSKPYYEYNGPGNSQLWYVDDIMYLTEIDRILAFATGDRGKGTQRATPCRNGNCVQPGNIIWQCVASYLDPPNWPAPNWII